MRYDVPLRSFLVAMWVIAFVAIFGLESKYLIFEQQMVVLPAVLVVLFVVVPLVGRQLLLVDAISRRTSGFLALSENLRLKPAPEAVANWVNERARALGIPGSVSVLTIPDFACVNARAVERGNGKFIALTVKAQSLLLSSRPEMVEEFRVLVDHELGHLANKDVGALFLARAIFFAMIVFVPLKFGIELWIGPENIGKFYTSLLPEPVQWVPIGIAGRGSSLYVRGDLPFWVVALLFIAFNAGTILCLWWLYRAISRRREFLADRFAMLHGESPERTEGVFIRLLGQDVPVKSSPISFLGSARWHPPPDERLQRLREPDSEPFVDAVGLSVAIAALLYLRYMFGSDSFLPPRGFELGVLMVSSAVGLLLIGYVMAPFSFSSGSSFVDRALSQLKAFTLAIAISAGIAVAFWALQTVLSNFYGSGFSDFFPTEAAMAETEFFDRTLLIFSMPVCVAAFAITYGAFGLFPQPRKRASWMAAAKYAVCAVLSLVVLVILTNLAQEDIGKARWARMKPAYYSLLLDVNAREACRDTDADRLSVKTCDDEYRENVDKLRALEARIGIDSFHPPLSFVLFWDQPFQGRWY